MIAQLKSYWIKEEPVAEGEHGAQQLLIKAFESGGMPLAYLVLGSPLSLGLSAADGSTDFIPGVSPTVTLISGVAVSLFGGVYGLVST